MRAHAFTPLLSSSRLHLFVLFPACLCVICSGLLCEWQTCGQAPGALRWRAGVSLTSALWFWQQWPQQWLSTSRDGCQLLLALKRRMEGEKRVKMDFFTSFFIVWAMMQRSARCVSSRGFLVDDVIAPNDFWILYYTLKRDKTVCHINTNLNSFIWLTSDRRMNQRLYLSFLVPLNRWSIKCWVWVLDITSSQSCVFGL